MLGSFSARSTVHNARPPRRKDYEAISGSRTWSACRYGYWSRSCQWAPCSGQATRLSCHRNRCHEPRGLRQRVCPQGPGQHQGGWWSLRSPWRNWRSWSETGNCPFRYATKAGYHYSLGQSRILGSTVQTTKQYALPPLFARSLPMRSPDDALQPGCILVTPREPERDAQSP